MDALFELEQRVAALPGTDMPGTTPGTNVPGTGTPTPVGGLCQRPDTSEFSNSSNNATSITRWARIQADIILNAFTCDRTRVADYHFSFSGGHHEGLLGFSQSWHDLVAHISRSNDSVSVGGQSVTTRQAFIQFDRFWASHIAYLVKGLAAIQEGNGTMLDNTILVWGVESGTNHNHSPRDMQYLIFGGKNLGVKQGAVHQQHGSSERAQAPHLRDERARVWGDWHRHRTHVRPARRFFRLI